MNKGKVLDRVGKGFEPILDREGYARMMTLTLGPKADNNKIGKYWARFRSYLLKYYGLKLAFFWVKEFTQAGRLHMHVLIDQYVHWSKIKKAWRWATYETSYVIHLTGSKSSGIYNPAGYMMKYMTKTCKDERFGRKVRRYGFSRTTGFNPPRKDKSGDMYSPVFGTGPEAIAEAQGLQKLLQHLGYK